MSVARSEVWEKGFFPLGLSVYPPKTDSLAPT